MDEATSCTWQRRAYHTTEAYRVLDRIKGIPTLTTHVLPFVTLDLVSWSSYEGMESSVTEWQDIELIRHYMLASLGLGGNAVFIGEVGEPEQNATGAEVF